MAQRDCNFLWVLLSVYLLTCLPLFLRVMMMPAAAAAKNRAHRTGRLLSPVLAELDQVSEDPELPPLPESLLPLLPEELSPEESLPEEVFSPMVSVPVSSSLEVLVMVIVPVVLLVPSDTAPSPPTA